MSRPHTFDCPVARILNTFGDRWTWLIVREAFYGRTRFSEFQRSIGIAKNLLSERLSHLVDEGIFERKNVGNQGTRYAYSLTDKGETLLPILVAMYQWGNEHVFGKGREPVLLINRKTKQTLESVMPRDPEGRPLQLKDIAARPGPAASEETKQKLAQSALALRKKAAISAKN